jgi:hypothetical protein
MENSPIGVHPGSNFTLTKESGAVWLIRADQALEEADGRDKTPVCPHSFKQSPHHHNTSLSHPEPKERPPSSPPKKKNRKTCSSL